MADCDNSEVRLRPCSNPDGRRTKAAFRKSIECSAAIIKDMLINSNNNVKLRSKSRRNASSAHELYRHSLVAMPHQSLQPPELYVEPYDVHYPQAFFNRYDGYIYVPQHPATAASTAAAAAAAAATATATATATVTAAAAGSRRKEHRASLVMTPGRSERIAKQVCSQLFIPMQICTQSAFLTGTPRGGQSIAEKGVVFTRRSGANLCCLELSNSFAHKLGCSADPINLRRVSLGLHTKVAGATI